MQQILVGKFGLCVFCFNTLQNNKDKLMELNSNSGNIKQTVLSDLKWWHFKSPALRFQTLKYPFVVVINISGYRSCFWQSAIKA